MSTARQLAPTAPPPTPASGRRVVYTDPAAEVLPWTGLSLVVALAGLFLLIAFPGSERASAAETVLGQEQEFELLHSLSDLRRALVAYHAEHGVWPDSRLAAGDPWGDWYSRNVAKKPQGSPVGRLAVLPLDAYFEGGLLPRNSANGLRTVRLLSAGERMPAKPDGTSGWLFDPGTGELRANAEGRLRASDRRVFDL